MDEKERNGGFLSTADLKVSRELNILMSSGKLFNNLIVLGQKEWRCEFIFELGMEKLLLDF